MKLSLIIPVYNVEKYLERCLDSCVRQNLSQDDYEIIIVNDGSPDNSDKIAAKFQNTYSNIHLFSQENQGLSVARNTGLSKAHGDYVWFIDSDDWIEENCLELIIQNLDNNIDLLQIQYRFTYDNANLNMDQPYCVIEGTQSGKELLKKGGVYIPAPFSIYRRQYLIDNHLSFYPKIYHEDLEFKPRALYFAKSCRSLNKVIYNYYQRNNGNITGHFTLKHGNDLLLIMDHMLDFSLTNTLDSVQRKYYYSIIGIAMNSFLIGLRQLNVDDRKTLISSLSAHKLFFFKMFASGKIKYMIESIFFILNIKLGLYFHSRLR